MKRFSLLCAGLVLCAAPASAQEQEDFSVAVKAINGGAIYEEKMSVDGSAVSEQYLLTHIVCTKGSRKMRFMLPLGPDDNGTTFTMDGAPSTLEQTPKGYRMTFTAYGRPVVKSMQLKPTNDKRSQNAMQFVIPITVGEPLWKAMLDPQPLKAMALIGTGGTPVQLPTGKKFDTFLQMCGL